MLRCNTMMYGGIRPSDNTPSKGSVEVRSGTEVRAALRELRRGGIVLRG